MSNLKRTEIKSLLVSYEYGKKINVKGWIRTKRQSKNVAFIALNDGSTIKNIQIVANVDNFDNSILEKATTGAAISVNGELKGVVGFRTK